MKAEAKKKIARKELEQRLCSAVTQITPNVLDRIDLSVPQEQAAKQASVISLNRVWKRMAAAAACVCLISVTGGIYAYGEMKVVSVVGIDVNPGIELSLNRRSKILKAEAVNTDGESILSAVDIKGKKLDQAVDSLVDSMLDQGYLKEEFNAVLVTVSDIKRGSSSVREEAVQDVEKTLQQKDVKAVVYKQEIEVTPELKETAEEYGISCGKAYFVQSLISESEELDMDDMEELSALNITQLSQAVESQKIVQADSESAEEAKPDPEEEMTEESTEDQNRDQTEEDPVSEEDSVEEDESEESRDAEEPVRRLADEDELKQEIQEDIGGDDPIEEELVKNDPVQPEEKMEAAIVWKPEVVVTPSDGMPVSSPSNGAATASPSDASAEEETEEETEEEEIEDEERENETEEEGIELELDIEVDDPIGAIE